MYAGTGYECECVEALGDEVDRCGDWDFGFKDRI